MDEKTKDISVLSNSEIKTKRFFYLALASSLLFLLLGLAVTLFDVNQVGESNTLIGLSTINIFLFNLFKKVEWLKTITDIFGIISIIIMVSFVCLGVYQLIKRKSLKKVDLDIYMIGAVYATIAIVYIFFEIFVINYRPVLVDGVKESSFPSSHTLLIFTVLLTSIYEINKRITNEKIKKVLIISSYVIMGITFFARFMCGYHWFTDVLASLLLSLIISFIFYGFIELFKSKNILN